MQLLNTSTAVTREFLLLYTYLLPTITLCAVFGINYLLGALAVNRLCKRYLPGKAEKLCFLPFVRYYYVGKLAFSGKFNSKGLSWVGIAFPIFEGLRVIGSLAMEIMRTVFAYASTVF